MASLVLDSDALFSRLDEIITRRLAAVREQVVPLDLSRLPANYLLTEKECAQALNCSVRTLQSWRVRKSVLRFRRLNGRAIRYAVEDVRRLIDESGCRSTSERDER